MRRTLACILALLGLLVTGPARADVDPRLAAAIERWLNDDDAGSLPVMAELARDGDTDARLLLGTIEQLEMTPGSWIAALDRDGRIALFRAPFGLSGTSWLAVEAPDNALAQALLDARAAGSRIGAARRLMALGEPRAAATALRAELSGGAPADLVRMHVDGPFPRRALYAAWIAASYRPGEPHTPALLLAGLDAAARGEPQGLLFVAGAARGIDMPLARVAARYVISGRSFPHRPVPEDSAALDGALARWLLDDAEAAPVAGLCRRLCPDAVDACAIAAYRLSGGYPALLRLNPPLETAIPGDRFDGSRRAQGIVQRQVLARRDGSGSPSRPECLWSAAD
ncbi:MAG: hypothetical protein VYB54_01055 [Pseudomonadota bacterium]|nr:hypothetical protein [Pseudomonadota bacterium]